MAKRILVLGSCTIDHTTFTDVMPEPGITGKATSFFRNVGGKGANQAAAAHYLNSDVYFIGSVGNDDEGAYIESFLTKVGLPHTLKKSDKQSGVASITINNKTGENQILIVQGANLDIDKDDIHSYEKLFKESDIFLTQLETSYESIEAGLKLAKKYGLLTILNPAPYMELKDDLYQYIDFFIPNEHEMDQYVPGNCSYEDKARVILNKGVKNVIVTLGEKGSLLVNKEKVLKVEPYKVKAIDTTAAGDSYLGALVTALANNKVVEEAMDFASKCSSITVTRIGAIASLPKLNDIE